MANLNLEDFSEEYRKTAPMECSLYLVSCLDKDTQMQLKKDWNEAGGFKVIPYWKWCMEHIDVRRKDTQVHIMMILKMCHLRNISTDSLILMT